MSRLPFNPEESRGPAGDPADTRPARRDRKRFGRVTDAQQLTVSQLADLIKTTLEERIASPLRVVGEVSNLNARDHWYFSLKDDAAVVSCVAWASAAKKFNFTPKEGDEVVATGHVSHFAPQGRTQFYVTKLEPVGAGALELQFRRLCDELRALGYFAAERKKPLPVFPRRIAVITSASGAALQDVIATAAQRCKAVGLVLVDVRVQGEGAKEQIANAIKWADRNHAELGVDAILVTRGGGSMEDLWAFNERIVADAAYTCSIPMVAAVGHESDTTLIELIADVRASTPTQAIMRLVPDAKELHQQVSHHAHRLDALARRLVERKRERLAAITRHEAFRDPELLLRRAAERTEIVFRTLERVVRGRVSEARSRLERCAAHLEALRPMTLISGRHRRLAVAEDRLARAMHHWLQRQRERVDGTERELIAIDPRHVLRRGYSYTTKPDGSLIRSIGDVRTGDALVTNLADGTVHSIVGEALQRTAKLKRIRKPVGRRETDSEQMDLFDSPDA
ncbi:MAG TPA: exodeoxyribonuclease VII large subunit [Phycisphaerales bacterium]|nr:exodeoxyribonuclease VII large subunit [Phycisphaerales bacterium]HRQ75461.1 exodeoxyribonuclease VII large subunit [Phycisphaerales bacterium]